MTFACISPAMRRELINAGGIASVKPREAELLCVSIDVERIQFNRGFYSVDIRFSIALNVKSAA